MQGIVWPGLIYAFFKWKLAQKRTIRANQVGAWMIKSTTGNETVDGWAFRVTLVSTIAAASHTYAHTCACAHLTALTLISRAPFVRAQKVLVCIFSKRNDSPRSSSLPGLQYRASIGGRGTVLGEFFFLCCEWIYIPAECWWSEPAVPKAQSPSYVNTTRWRTVLSCPASQRLPTDWTCLLGTLMEIGKSSVATCQRLCTSDCLFWRTSGSESSIWQP